MKFVNQTISDVLVIEPHVYDDERGFLWSLLGKIFDAAVGRQIRFVQDNESKSAKGSEVTRAPFTQAKLVRVLEGEVLDVAVDLRSFSPTFGQHVVVRLSSVNRKQQFIPQGFAHGFVVLSDTAIFSQGR